MPIQTISFHVPFVGVVDAVNAVIRDVSVITGNVEAEGHDLVVDNTTVSQLFAAAQKTGQIPVNLDHASGIKDTCGYLNNFRIAGHKLRADWHLLETHEETPRMLERAERMPGCFGLSVKFKGKGEKKGLKKFARCEKLISVDCVTQPAANPDGLFSVPVDTHRKGMATRKAPTGESEPTLADIFQLIQEQGEQLADIGTRVEASEQFQQDLAAQLGDEPAGDPEDEGDPNAELTDEQIDALVAQGALINDGRGGLVWADSQGEGEGEGEGEMAGAGAGAEGGAALSAIREIHQFRAQLRTAQNQQSAADEVHAFEQLDERIEMLAAQNEDLNELAVAQEAQIVALQRTIRLGGGQRPAPSRGSTHLFSAKGGDENSFEAIVTAKYMELKEGGKLTDLQCRSQATDFGVRQNREAYAEYRDRGGQISFARK
ncbi:MAG: hypothetical protein QOE70_4034 [Chthoniobacter sp.]|jgi:hypothetical protein|nr:hypothetical protein [Chthoniobacter sp.]